ncbi:response regulator [Gracilibacillus oryzae]|uniref:Response regulator n=1 Tax=Gracilibacillus oryzae TaxID=1672701 RepID=A0A7C8GU15_9BACI|nr:response regulator [Gracilibacillus oryzae]KAB8138046.1 response regulator [Gracilibacillus oryzae]
MKVILFDDELHALKFFEHQIKNLKDVKIIGQYTQPYITNKMDQIRDADLIFIDIEMPEVSGLQLAKQILQSHPKKPIVFVTAFKEYAAEAFEIDALDYIVKPIELKRLQVTFERARAFLASDITSHSNDKPLLHINLFKELTFALLNQDQRIVYWRTSKAKELFLYLLQQHGRAVHSSELIEVLFPHIDVDKAISQLYVTIHHVRKTVKEFEGYISITNHQKGYILLLNNVKIDVAEFEKQLSDHKNISTETISELEEILKLYTGSFLESYDYLWAVAERERLDMIWLQAASQIANYYRDRGSLDKAAEWYLKICKMNPDNEQAHYSLMQVYASLGYHLLVEHQYNELRLYLQDLNLPMSSFIKKWYEGWRKSI